MFSSLKVSSVAVTTATLMVPGLAASAADLSYVTSFGTFGSGNGQFFSPYGVTVDSSGNVYVADNNNIRIVELNSGVTIPSQVPEPSELLGILALVAIGLVSRFRVPKSPSTSNNIN